MSEKLTNEELAVITRMITGALFDFAGMLTTLEKPVTLSAKHNAAPMVDLLKEFLIKRDVPDCSDPFVKEWNVLLTKAKG
jgi:hypothetical protein